MATGEPFFSKSAFLAACWILAKLLPQTFDLNPSWLKQDKSEYNKSKDVGFVLFFFIFLLHKILKTYALYNSYGYLHLSMLNLTGEVRLTIGI